MICIQEPLAASGGFGAFAETPELNGHSQIGGNVAWL